LYSYDTSQAVLPPRADLDKVDFKHMEDEGNVNAIAAASEIVEPVDLSEAEVAELIVFLHALTDPASLDLRTTVPVDVPSGLPLAD
jgi:cytochrome c peroxidase